MRKSVRAPATAALYVARFRGRAWREREASSDVRRALAPSTRRSALLNMRAAIPRARRPTTAVLRRVARGASARQPRAQHTTRPEGADSARSVLYGGRRTNVTWGADFAGELGEDYGS
jgi:hypothetical protein